MVVAFHLCPVGNLVGSLIGNFARRVNAAADAMVTHHKLKVYQKALALGASAAEFSSRWGGAASRFNGFSPRTVETVFPSRACS